MSPDGSRFTLVTSDDYYAIQVRSAHTGQLLQTLDATNSVSTVAYSPSGRGLSRVITTAKWRCGPLTPDISGC